LRPTATLTTFQTLSIGYPDVAWSEDGSRLLIINYQTGSPQTGGSLAVIQVTDALTGTIVHTTPFTTNPDQYSPSLTDWALSPDGRWLAGGPDYSVPGPGCVDVTIYDALSGQPSMDRFKPDPNSVSDKQIQQDLNCLFNFAWSADSKLIAA